MENLYVESWDDIAQRKDSPISKLFKYKIVNDTIHILLENLRARITQGKDIGKPNDDHLKKVKNVIYWAIILYQNYHSEDSPKKFATIILHYKNNDILREETLPLIMNQSKYLSVQIVSDPDLKVENSTFEFKRDWAASLNDNHKARVQAVKTLLKEQINSYSEKVQLYKTITSPEIQIRYRGYQIGKFTTKDEIVRVNGTKELTFSQWSKVLIEGRRDVESKYYHEKLEHYSESTMLEMLYSNKLEINGLKVSPVFSETEFAFQFPALMYGQESELSNHPKYIDIMGKANDQPVLMELKIWGKSNSRGQYLFEAFSQLLCYYHYYSELKNSRDENFQTLSELYSLDWEHPILLVVVNDIGDVTTDPTTKRFLQYIKTIKSYFTPEIDIHFIEFSNDAWSNREVNFIKERC